MATTPVTLQNSSYFDYTSYGTTTAATVEAAYDITLFHPYEGTINVALTLPRANDPTELLTSDWGTRQKELNEAGPLNYGTSQTLFDQTVATLTDHTGLNLKVLGLNGATDGYISSAESRTIWVSLSQSDVHGDFQSDFHSLFNAELYQSGVANGKTNNQYIYWNNDLSLPANLIDDIEGIWFDAGPTRGQLPAVSDQSNGGSISPSETLPSIGNALNDAKLHNYASDIADWYYNFPLTNAGVSTATIGLIEPRIGIALEENGYDLDLFKERLKSFREAAGILTDPNVYAVAPNGESYEDAGERSMDVAIVTTASPESTIGLYAGSGPNATSYTAFQQAFWDPTYNPAVVSASFGFNGQTNPDSPFARAINELYVDAALHNITVVKAFNDSGSSFGYANGLANAATNDASPYAMVVSGTSLTTLAGAAVDDTVSGNPSSVYNLAMAGDQATLWGLVKGGLNVLPSAVSWSDTLKVALIESVWNTLTADNYQDTVGTPTAADGGVDIYRPTPWYQTNFGLTPTSANPGGGTGRGAPDVSAIAGGNMWYQMPDENMLGHTGSGDGTSGAAPMWAALMAQMDTIFTDQKLPNMGFATDLLYQAAAIAPAAFNDITYGNNVSSFYLDSSGQAVLTGHGYYAGPGYDLATGLGSPNGTLLARALTAIAHSQMSHSSRPDMFEAGSDSQWQSGTDQSLIFQAMSADDQLVSLAMGNTISSFSSGVANTYAWTNQLAQQSLQADFDPDLVRLFDGHQQGGVLQSSMVAGENLMLGIGGSPGHALQGTLSNPFGFADFMTEDGAVRVARPVAVAETVDALNHQTAVLRLRQNGADDLSLQLYKVDDLAGTIDGLHPGDAGYEAAAARRAYHTDSGDTSVTGPGYGEYGQTTIQDVNSGDIIAMKLTNRTTGESYWGFDQANEKDHGEAVGHLWNYGLNTWGFEDTHAGGDRDFNDLILQLDFTSAYGHGWLI